MGKTQARLLGPQRAARKDRARARYDWARAKKVVLSAFGDLAPDFAARAEGFFDRPWIDAEPRPGKNSGAYLPSGDRRPAPVRAAELHAASGATC